MGRRLCLVLGLASFLAIAETKVFENFALIDGTGKAAAAGSALIVTDGRITWVGPKASLKVPAGAQRIDLTGKYVMPGIINLHGHLGNVIGIKQDPSFFTRENVEKQLKTYASYGVTAMISMGSDKDIIFPMRAEQRAGRPTMTRIFTAGRGFTGKGGYPTTVPGNKGIPYEVSTAAEVQKDIEELAAKKVDLVKIWVDDHLGKEAKIPLEMCQAIISNARKHGLKTVAHVFYLDDAKALVDSGLAGLMHSVRDKPVDDALIAAMKKRGAWMAASTFTREMSVFVYTKRPPFFNDPFFARSVSKELMDASIVPPDAETAKFPGFLATAKQNLKKLADSGVKYGFGTDSGPPKRFPGYFEHWEFELMTEAGLTPAQVIRAATGSAAEFLGAKDLGTIENGKWADMIVLARNPLTDIKNTRSIESVWIAGNKVQ
jgi:imidazolonepropionase-like amidohydrolase